VDEDEQVSVDTYESQRDRLAWTKKINLPAWGAFGAFLVASGFNAWAAHDSSVSSEAAKTAAQAEQKSAEISSKALTLEASPALVVHCAIGANGKPDYLLPVAPAYQDHGGGQVFQRWWSDKSYSYTTCEVRNYGRVAALAVTVYFRVSFGTTGARSRHLLDRDYHVTIDGIGPDDRSSIWIFDDSEKYQASVILGPVLHYTLPDTREVKEYSLPAYVLEIISLNPRNLPASLRKLKSPGDQFP
jgi:hypothetical protein